MRIFKHRKFHQWTKSEGIGKKRLKQAVEELKQGLFDAKLGGGLYKKRIARDGQGKREGYRTLVAFQDNDRVVFMYGFAKNKRPNINQDEAEAYKKLAKYYLSIAAEQLEKLIELGKLIEVL